MYQLKFDFEQNFCDDKFFVWYVSVIWWVFLYEIYCIHTSYAYYFLILKKNESFIQLPGDQYNIKIVFFSQIVLIIIMVWFCIQIINRRWWCQDLSFSWQFSSLPWIWSTIYRNICRGTLNMKYKSKYLSTWLVISLCLLIVTSINFKLFIYIVSSRTHLVTSQNLCNRFIIIHLKGFLKQDFFQPK